MRTLLFPSGSSANPTPARAPARVSLFIPRREVRTHCPDGVQLKVFPIYIALVNEKGVFRNTNVNRPFSNRRKTLLSGWVGGWVGGDILGPLIFLKIGYNNKQDVLIPNMASKVVYAAIRSKVMSNLSFK